MESVPAFLPQVTWGYQEWGLRWHTHCAAPAPNPNCSAAQNSTSCTEGNALLTLRPVYSDITNWCGCSVPRILTFTTHLSKVCHCMLLQAYSHQVGKPTTHWQTRQTKCTITEPTCVWGGQCWTAAGSQVLLSSPTCPHGSPLAYPLDSHPCCQVAPFCAPCRS